MKLSEAIRLGSMVSEQWFNNFFAPYHPIKSCALGAASIAINVDPIDLDIEFPILNKIYDNNCFFATATLKDIIVWWNDRSRLTREEIANRVEAFENELEAKQKSSEAEATPILVGS